MAYVVRPDYQQNLLAGAGCTGDILITQRRPCTNPVEIAETITFYDRCCGSGGTIIGLAETAKEKVLNCNQ